MYRPLCNILASIRRFVRSEVGHTNGIGVGGTAQPIRNKFDLCRCTTLKLTRSGILFQGLRYHSKALTEMLLDDRARAGSESLKHVRVTIKWDPSDASRISVRNRDRPDFGWATIPIAGTSAGPRLSFAHHAAVRDSAKARDLGFLSEKELRERLRRHWENLADLPPTHELRQSTRDAVPWVGLSDDDSPRPYKDPSTEIKVPSLGPNRKSPLGRKLSKPAIAKAKRTKQRKKAEATAMPASQIPKAKRN